MSQDIRKCGRAELDEMNRQIAIYKASSNLGTMVPNPDQQVNPNSDSPLKRDTKAEQLELL